VLLVSTGVLAAAPGNQVVMQPNPFACCIGMLSLCRVLYQYGFSGADVLYIVTILLSGFSVVHSLFQDLDSSRQTGQIVKQQTILVL
jgi:hypothetical protein